MDNINHHPIRARLRMPLVVFPLLALLFVFLSSVTQLQLSGARSDHGFTGTLNYLVVASQTESIRSQNGDNDDTALDGDGNNAQFWAAKPTDPRAKPRGTTTPRPTYVVDLQSATHFLKPLLRAPPQA